VELGPRDSARPGAVGHWEPDVDCLVLWCSPSALARSPEHRGGAPLLPLDWEDLGEQDRQRVQSHQPWEDRARSATAALLLRRAVATVTGRPPWLVELRRECDECGRPHGRPRLPGTGLHASITHSGMLVGVALTAAAPVGLDVEQVTSRPVLDLVRLVSGPGEVIADSEAFYRSWCRKESVVKATGEGLRVPLQEVLVPAPAGRPGLVRVRGAELDARTTDLRPGAGYRAAVTVLTAAPARVVQRELGAWPAH